MPDVDGEAAPPALARKGRPVPWAVVTASVAMTLTILISGLAWDVMQGGFDGLGEASLPMVGAVLYLVYAEIRAVRRHRPAFLAGVSAFFALALLGWALTQLLRPAHLIILELWVALIGPAMVAAHVAVTRIGAGVGAGAGDDASPRVGKPVPWRVTMLLAAGIGCFLAAETILRFLWHMSLFSTVAGAAAIATAAGLIVVNAAAGVRRAGAALAVGFAAGLAGMFGGAVLAAMLLPQHFLRMSSTFGLIRAGSALIAVAAFTVVTRTGRGSTT